MPSHNPVESRDRLLGSLAVLVFMINMGRVVFAPLLEPLMSALDIGPGMAGTIASLAWIGSAVLRIPTGWALTKVPRHHVLLATGTGLSVAAMFTFFAPTVELIAVGAFLIGLATGPYFIAANPLVSELYPERVGRVIGIHGTASQLAAVAAPFIVGVVLLVGDWRDVFVFIALATALATGSLYRVARRADLPDAGNADRDFVLALKKQWRIVLTGIALIGFAGFVWNGVFNFYVTYLAATKGIDPARGRDLLMVIFAAGVPAFWFTGQLADRVRQIPLTFVIIGGFATALFALTLIESFVGLVVVTIAIGYLVHGLFPALDTFMLSSLPDEHRASAYAVYGGGMLFIGALGSSVVGLLTEAGFTFDAIFQGFAVALVGLLVVLFGLYRGGFLPGGR